MCNKFVRTHIVMGANVSSTLWHSSEAQRRQSLSFCIINLFYVCECCHYKVCLQELLDVVSIHFYGINRKMYAAVGFSCHQTNAHKRSTNIATAICMIFQIVVGKYS